jgi:hypothetical protein
VKTKHTNYLVNCDVQQLWMLYFMNIRNIRGIITISYTVFMFPFVAHDQDFIRTVHTQMCACMHTAHIQTKQFHWTKVILMLYQTTSCLNSPSGFNDKMCTTGWTQSPCNELNECFNNIHMNRSVIFTCKTIFKFPYTFVLIFHLCKF